MLRLFGLTLFFFYSLPAFAFECPQYFQKEGVLVTNIRIEQKLLDRDYYLVLNGTDKGLPVILGDLLFDIKDETLTIGLQGTRERYRQLGVQDLLFKYVKENFVFNKVFSGPLIDTNIDLFVFSLVSSLGLEAELSFKNFYEMMKDSEKAFFASKAFKQYELLNSIDKKSLINKAIESTPLFKSLKKIGFTKICPDIPPTTLLSLKTSEIFIDFTNCP